MYRYIITFCLAIPILAGSIFAGETRRDFLVYYDDPNWPYTSDHDSVVEAQRVWIAQRYEFGIAQKVEAGDRLRELNPDFGWFTYNSLQDNYIKNSDTREHDWLMNAADSLGYDPEEAYLHYIDDTYQILQGKTIFIKGYPNGSATSLAEARVPCYYGDTSRINCHYSTPEARQLYIGYVKYVLSNYATDGRGNVANTYFSGVFWDNATPALWNLGTIVSGGHVREHPSNARLDSIRSLYGGDDWWYQSNMRPFLQDLMDTLANSANWMPNQSKLRILINTVGETDIRLTEDNVTHMLFQEFFPSISKNNVSTFQPFYANDSAGEANGVNVLYSPTVRTTYHTLAESLHGNLAWFYISRSDSAIFFQQRLNGPSTFGYDTTIWCGSMDVDMGQPTGKYSIPQSGTDGLGYSYKIFRREFDNGIVLLRLRGGGSETISSATDVNYNLGGTYYEVYPDGTVGPAVTTTKMRNAQGRIFLTDPSVTDPSSDNIPPDSILDFSSRPDTIVNGSVILSWQATGDDGREGYAASYTLKYATQPITTSNWNNSSVTTNYGSPAPDTAGSPESLVINGLKPGEEYYFGILANDESGNKSGIVTASGYARGILTPRIAKDTIILDQLNREATLYADTVKSYLNIVYEFQLATDSFFTNYNYLTDSNVTDRYAKATMFALELDRDYYCRVQAKSKDGSIVSQPSSNSFSFNLVSGVKNNLPDTAHPYSPEYGASITELNPILTVNNSYDADGDLLTYNFELYNSDTTTLISSANNIAQSSQYTSWQVPTTLGIDSTYNWRARAYDGLAYSDWSEYFSFTVIELSSGFNGNAQKIHYYPNPVRFGDGGTVSFFIGDEPVDIMIQTTSGARVLYVKDVSGTWEWNGYNSSGVKVVPGTYLWYASGNRGYGKIVAK